MEGERRVCQGEGRMGRHLDPTALARVGQAPGGHRPPPASAAASASGSGTPALWAAPPPEPWSAWAPEHMLTGQESLKVTNRKRIAQVVAPSSIVQMSGSRWITPKGSERTCRQDHEAVLKYGTEIEALWHRFGTWRFNVQILVQPLVNWFGESDLPTLSLGFLVWKVICRDGGKGREELNIFLSELTGALEIRCVSRLEYS